MNFVINPVNAVVGRNYKNLLTALILFLILLQVRKQQSECKD